MITDFELELAELRALADAARREGTSDRLIAVRPATLLRILDALKHLRSAAPAPASSESFPRK